MSLLAFIVVAFGSAGLAIVVRSRVRAVTVIGLLGLAAAVVAAVAIDPAQVISIGETGVATTAYVRLFLIVGSLAGLGLAIAGTAAGTRRDAPAVTLAILGAAGLTLGLVDVRAAVLAATAGGLFGVLVTLVPRGARAGATVGILEARAVVVAGALAIVATAWFGRDLSQMAAQPVVFGLAYLAFAIAVAIRFGEIPFHLWAARLTDVVPETSLPVLTALAPASLAIVALAWIDGSVTPLAVDLDAERLIVLGVALASIILAGVAATLQEDIEHVLGYSIVGDAGVIILAFVALDPAAGPPARLWVLAFVVARSAFAAWVAGIRAGFWTGRVADLRGWARRSPVLAVAFLLVVLASVGFPGMAAFDAKSSLVSLSLDPRLATPVLLATLLPLVYCGRLLAIGLARPDREAEPVDAWRPRLTRPDVTAVRPWLQRSWEANRGFTTALIAALLGLLAVATSAGAFDGPATASAPPAQLPSPSPLIEPSSSGAVPSASGEPPSTSETP